MTDHALEVLFAEWWEESYGRPPGTHATMTHVAFGRHLLQLHELLQPAPQEAPAPQACPSGSAR